MRTTLALIAAAVVAGFPASTWAQSLADICATETLPTMAEYESNPTAYADNFCALATYAPQRAASQLNKTVSLVRQANNPNRHYFDPKSGVSAGTYIQLLRPWMTAAGWRVRQTRLNDNSEVSAYFFSPFDNNFHLGVSSYGVDDHPGTNEYRPSIQIYAGNNAWLWYGIAACQDTVHIGALANDCDPPTDANELITLVHNALDCVGHFNSLSNDNIVAALIADGSGRELTLSCVGEPSP